MNTEKTPYETNTNIENILRIKDNLPFEELLAKRNDGLEEAVHKTGNDTYCSTDGIGYAHPDNKSDLELMIHTFKGSIPLWEQNKVLNWRFDEKSFTVYPNPKALKSKIVKSFGKALLRWGDAAPIRFRYDSKLYDFEISMSPNNKCRGANLCTLARAFFPDAGRHYLIIYPKMFQQSEKEQIDTFIHETGHIFGLRHFFAKVSETHSPSEVFGHHDKNKPFSIMNYGKYSTLTDHDKNDLKTLYQEVWSGKRKQINGTPINLFRPYHYQINTSMLAVLGLDNPVHGKP